MARKIMIVEDEIITAMALSEELIRLGYEVCDPIPSGEMAVQEIGKEKPDLVLMDINLSGTIDGIEVAEQIRSSDNGPLVAFMTGYPDPKMREKARELGAVGYFIKPLDYERICSMIGTFFQEGQEMVEVAG